MTNVISGLITICVLLLAAWIMRELVGLRLGRIDRHYRAEFAKDYYRQNVQLTRCQQANGALRQQLAEKHARLRAENLRVQQLEGQLHAARQQPATPDPDREPTFTEIVTEIASHVSTLKEEPALGTAPDPADQVVVGTVVITPTGTAFDSEEPGRA